MYSPPYNRIEDRAELLAFLRANSFAVLVTRELRASHLPVQVRATESELILDMHMARANPQWQDFFDDEALVVFSGPHAYVSPRWYEEQERVPTWNYASVHAYGVPKVIQDRNAKHASQRRLVTALDPQWLADWARQAALESGGRATAEEKIHLTLAFLGEAEPEKAIAGARRVRGQSHSLPVQQAAHWKHNSIIWAGPHTTPLELLKLAENLQMQLYLQEFILERRAFAAHITLVRKAREPGQLPGLPRIEWPVEEFLLVRSISGRYEPLERFPIA